MDPVWTEAIAEGIDSGICGLAVGDGRERSRRGYTWWGMGRADQVSRQRVIELLVGAVAVVVVAAVAQLCLDLLSRALTGDLAQLVGGKLAWLVGTIVLSLWAAPQAVVWWRNLAASQPARSRRREPEEERSSRAADNPDDWEEIILDQPDARRLPDLKKELASLAWESEPAVVEIVDRTLSQAIAMHASDVHFEPGPSELSLRFRIDGALVDVAKLPKDLHGAVTNRLKVMSRLSSFEHDVPQDGRVFAEIGGRSFDIRISFLTTLHGEKVALRILDTSGGSFELENLGLSRRLLATYCELLRRPQGIIFVTGPTGSGKTTTLYASLRHIKNNSAGMVNIVTLEDPVEFAVPDFSQTQVREETGLTFAKGLRSILRQDPDVIMVGEIRDSETAQIALQAGLTGHLLLTTVHADATAGVFSRLMNMGLEPFLLSSAVAGVLSQRLVRVLCRNCSQPAVLSERQRRLLLEAGVDFSEEVQFTVATGCDACFRTGYRGRTVLAELLPVTEEVKQAIIDKVPAAELSRAARKMKIQSLLENGLTKALAGETSVDEVLRVTRG